MDHLVVDNKGYLSVNDVDSLIKEGVSFGIYRTHKGTEVLLIDCFSKGKKPSDKVILFRPIENKREWKIEPGKSIVSGELIFNSEVDEKFNTDGWNNGNQIISYILSE